MTGNENKKICFFGSGNMAEAIVKGILDKSVFPSNEILCVDVSDDRLQYMKSTYQTDVLNISDKANFGKLAEISVYVLAVKPNNASEILTILRNFIAEKKQNKIIISIMAGMKIEKIKMLLNSDETLQIVRVMPNTPALFGEGAIGYSFCENVSLQNKQLTTKILAAVGNIFELAEKDLDAVTALSGSGPAYVFYLAEAMIEAGIEIGLTAEIARKLTIQTIFGAGLMLKNSDETPESLRAKVTSKGGTTQAATEYFDENNMKEIVKNALKKAKEKSIQLSLLL